MKKSAILMIIFFTVSCSKQLRLDMKIHSYTGTVLVNTQVVKEIHKELKQGDAVETGADSSCDIIINEKNILRLKPNTKITLKLTDKESILQLDKGWLAGVTRKVFSSEGKYTVKTPTVTAAIRGTSFCVKVENEKSTYFCTCNGSIELKGESSSKSETVTAPHHAARRFSIDKTGALIEDNNPGVLYHDDNGLEEVARVIDERIDWNTPDSH